MPRHVSFLLDNGSLRAEAVLNLRRIASELSHRVGEEVQPVSLLHSSGIDAVELEGMPAEILEPAIRKRAEEGMRNFNIIPLFFGPSRALTEYLPERINALANHFPGLRVKVAPPLVDLADPQNITMAEILCEEVKKVISQNNLIKPKVILVDHGTPAKEVNAVRNHLAGQMKLLLRACVTDVRSASMERRAGETYDFNEPLLESLLSERDFASGDIVVSKLFLSPGRHAGPSGDIDTICRKAEKKRSELRTHLTALVGENPKLVNVLEKIYLKTLI